MDFTLYQTDIQSFTRAYPDAHLTLCGYAGKPKAAPPGWNASRPSSADAIAHAGRALVGVIPASVGMTVLDVDEGNPLALGYFLRPEYFTNSGTAGHGHLWFRDITSRENRNWYLRSQDGRTWSGEVRGGNGYVVLWAPEILAARLTLDADGSARTYGEIEGWLKRPGDDDPAPTCPPPGRRRMVDPQSAPRAIDRAVALVSRIPPDDYDTWVTVGQCLEGSARKGEFTPENARQLWMNWSARSSKYPGDRTAGAKWDSFKGGSPRTLGTLVRLYGE